MIVNFKTIIERSAPKLVDTGTAIPLFFATHQEQSAKQLTWQPDSPPGQRKSGCLFSCHAIHENESVTIGDGVCALMQAISTRSPRPCDRR